MRLRLLSLAVDVIGIMFVFFCAFMAGVAQKQFSMEREAVKHGAATWSVDENGNRVFKWRDIELGEDER